MDPDRGEIFYAGPQIPELRWHPVQKSAGRKILLSCEMKMMSTVLAWGSYVGQWQGAKIALCLTIGTVLEVV